LVFKSEARVGWRTGDFLAPGDPFSRSVSVASARGSEPTKLERTLDAVPAETPIDWAIVILGSADLSMLLYRRLGERPPTAHPWRDERLPASPGQIVDNLRALHRQIAARAGPATRFLFALPRSRPWNTPEFGPDRARLEAEHISNLARLCRTLPRATFVKLPDAFADHNTKFLFDGLHPTSLGSEAIGIALADAIIKAENLH
jgi:lysophospholipase L1-like esterase